VITCSHGHSLIVLHLSSEFKLVEINKKERVLSSKEPAVTGDEKRESTKVGFKTGANSASPNANRLEGNNAEGRTQLKSNATKQLKG